jgi:serine/threonine protein kinase
MKAQEGGKLLGQGVYGCAFNPPLHCVIQKKGSKIESSKRKVGKLTWPMYSENEVFISEVLKNLKNYRKYFILIENSCIPETKNKQTEKDIEACKITQEIDFKDTVQLIMPYGGKPLFTVPKNIRNIHFFDLFQHMLEAGALLIKQKVVHNDLHVMNILLEKPSVGHIIDFGMSWMPEGLTLANLQGLYRVYNPRIAVEPPEISYLNGILDNVDPQLIFANIYDQKLPLHLVKAVYGISIESQIEELKRFVRISWSMEQENWYSFFKLYWASIDAWGLGVSMLTTFVDLTMDASFETSNAYQDKADLALQTLLGMCRCDPGKRLDCAEALALYAPDSETLRDKDVKNHLIEKEKIRRGLIAL